MAGTTTFIILEAHSALAEILWSRHFIFTILNEMIIPAKARGIQPFILRIPIYSGSHHPEVLALPVGMTGLINRPFEFISRSHCA